MSASAEIQRAAAALNTAMGAINAAARATAPQNEPDAMGVLENIEAAAASLAGLVQQTGCAEMQILAGHYRITIKRRRVRS